jgi:hypothetical protein
VQVYNGSIWESHSILQSSTGEYSNQGILLLEISIVLHDKLNNLWTMFKHRLIFSTPTVYCVGLGSCCWGNMRAGSWRSGIPRLLNQGLHLFY